jgi:hypothetical protein
MSSLLSSLQNLLLLLKKEGRSTEADAVHLERPSFKSATIIIIRSNIICPVLVFGVNYKLT